MDVNDLKDRLWKWWLDHDDDPELKKLFDQVEKCIDGLCRDLDDVYVQIDELRDMVFTDEYE